MSRDVQQYDLKRFDIIPDTEEPNARVIDCIEHFRKSPRTLGERNRVEALGGWYLAVVFEGLEMTSERQRVGHGGLAMDTKYV